MHLKFAWIEIYFETTDFCALPSTDMKVYKNKA